MHTAHPVLKGPFITFVRNGIAYSHLDATGGGLSCGHCQYQLKFGDNPNSPASSLKRVVKPQEPEIVATSGTGLTYQGKPRTAGFRLSGTDVAVLIATVVISALTFTISVGYSLFGIFVVFHFFLFCNVFRIRRTPELIWGGLFLLNCCIWAIAGVVNMYGIFASQLVATIVIIGYEIRVPTYHGVFAHRINPRIGDYLAGRI